MNNDTKNWMMRAGGSYLIEAFISNNTVSIGWNNLGPLYTYIWYKGIVRTEYPYHVDGRVNQSVGQIWQFTLLMSLQDALYRETQPYLSKPIVNNNIT